MRGLRSAVLGVALAGCALGCAQAVVRKVPKRSDYETWDDAKQREVDKMTGLRFYRARPYVFVKRPFIVASEILFVDAIVGADGRHARIVGECPRQLADALRHFRAPGGTTAVPVDRVWKGGVAAGTASTGTQAGLAQGGAVGNGGSPSAAGSPSSAPGAGSAAVPGGGNGTVGSGAGGGAPPPTNTSLASSVPPGTQGSSTPAPATQPPTAKPEERAADEPTGITEVRLTTDRQNAVREELSDAFQVIYLPDLEEEYVVDPRANLGRLDVSFTQGPGGVLMGIGMKVDNSSITDPIVDVYTDLVKAAGKSITKRFLPGEESGTIDPGAGEAMTPPKITEKAIGDGIHVTLRCHLLKYANVGLYPVLKAEELLDTRNCARVIRGSCGAGCNGLTNEQLAARTHLMPVYPYSRIAYQIHTAVLVEEMLTNDSRPVGEESGELRPDAADRIRYAVPTPLPADAGVTDADIARLINAALQRSPGTACLHADVEARTPAAGKLSDLKELRVSFAFRGVPATNCDQCIAAALEVVKGLGFPKEMQLSFTLAP